MTADRSRSLDYCGYVTTSSIARFYRDDRMTFGVGPGPAAYDTRKITNQGVDICHAPFVGEKLEGRQFFFSPGPAAYNRGKSDKAAFPGSPAFTMRIKPPKRKWAITPAPDAYTLPQTMGPGRAPFAGGPAFTIADRLDKNDYQCPSPGPAAYKLPSPNINKQRMPAFIMGAKTECTNFGTVTPGPASNFYHKVKFNKPSPPRYTFGVKHSPFKAFQSFAAEI